MDTECSSLFPLAVCIVADTNQSEHFLPSTLDTLANMHTDIYICQHWPKGLHQYSLNLKTLTCPICLDQDRQERVLLGG